MLFGTSNLRPGRSDACLGEAKTVKFALSLFASATASGMSHMQPTLRGEAATLGCPKPSGGQRIASMVRRRAGLAWDARGASRTGILP